MKRIGLMFAVVSGAACDGSSLTDAISTEAALTTAACTYSGAGDCFATYDACVAAEAADPTTCSDALHACLPAPSSRSKRDGGGGGMCGGGDRGGRGGEGGGGRGGGHPRGDPAVTAACHDAFDTCVSATGADQQACRDTERQCVRDALTAEFNARCADATATCAEAADDTCTRILERCAEGIEVRPVRADGGTACE